MVDFDEKTGPPRFVPGSHLRAAAGETIPDPEPPSVLAYCTRGSAIMMDQRVWHGGTANTSSKARPMLSVHFASPQYDELKRVRGKKVHNGPFHTYHRGAITQQQWTQLPADAHQLCKCLLPRLPSTSLECEYREWSWVEVPDGEVQSASYGHPGAMIDVTDHVKNSVWLAPQQ